MCLASCVAECLAGQFVRCLTDEFAVRFADCATARSASQLAHLLVDLFADCRDDQFTA